jgi:hypothetical protein
LARVLVPVNVAFVPVGAVFLIARPAVLCVGKHCGCQEQSQD